MRVIPIILALFFPVLLDLPPVGSPDPSFGEAGFTITSLSPGPDRSMAVAKQNDGKFVAAGLMNNGMRMAVVRYFANGDLDPTFGDNGVTTIFNGTTGNEVTAIALQNDGKIVLAGKSSVAGSTRFTIVRIDAGGNLDTTFNGSGIFADQSLGVPNAIAIQPDGKIVTGGDLTMTFGFTREFCIARFNTDGTIDESFGSDGKAIISMAPEAAVSFGRALVIQPDGRIVIGGESNYGFGLARVDTNGSLDTSFDSDGLVRTVFTSGERAFVNALANGPNGTIIAVGHAMEGDARGFAMARYTSDGSLDISFDGDGKTVILDTDVANAVAVEQAGSLTAVGYTGQELTLVKLTVTGHRDSSFGEDGIVRSAIRTGYAIGRGIVLDPSGFYIVVGDVGSGGPDSDVLFARYTSEGIPDVESGTYGYVTTNPFGEIKQSSYGVDVEQSSNGRLIVAANRVIGPDFESGALIGYKSNGSLDQNFGDGLASGIAPISISEAKTQEVNALSIQADDKIVVTGTFENQVDVGLFVGRFQSDGSKDLAFGNSGNGYITVLASEGGGLANDVLVQSDGKILVAATTPNFSTQTTDFGVYRFESNGSLDTKFGNGGITKVPMGTGLDAAFALAQDGEGRIIVVGSANLTESGLGDFAVSRLNPNGSIDGSFGNSGKLIFSASQFTNVLTDVEVQKDGKIVTTGTACANANCTGSSGVIARLTNTGEMDTTFGNAGVRQLLPGGTGSVISNSIKVRRDGKIIIAGSAERSATSKDALVARFLPNGDYDMSFGSNGIVFSDIELTNQEAASLTIQRNGKLVTAGSSSTDGRTDIAVWRYIDDDISFVEHSAPFDFDGDGKTDASIFRPANGEWWWQPSSGGLAGAVQFGSGTDIIVAGDFTGDGKTDSAVFRPSTGQWFVLQSEDFGYYAFPFGAAGDVPIAADMDGDGKADPVIFRPSTGVWYTMRSSDSQISTSIFGGAGDVPAVADYDGDGKDDVAVYRPNGASGAEWWYIQSSDGLLRAFSFGMAGDKPVPGDYTGDGKADVAFYRPSTGQWFVLQSEDFGYYAFPFGAAGDIPVPGDYDGDGRFDAAVFRPSDGNWYINGSTAGVMIQHFGGSSDLPVPNAYVH